MFYGRSNFNNSNDYLSNLINNNFQIQDNNYIRRSKSMDRGSSNFRNLNPRTTPLFKTQPKGLANIGATCYMNSTIQCFYHCKKLTNYLVTDQYKYDNISVPYNSITSAYINLVKELNYKNGQTDYAPYEFKDILGKKNPLFQGVAANDSKDLILFLEEELAKELAIKKNKNIYGNSNNFIDQTNEIETFKEMVKEFAKETSIIKDIFYFMMKTQSICKNCNAKLYNFQVMNFIIFPLKKAYEDSKNMSNTMTLNNFIANMNNSNNMQGLVNFNRINNSMIMSNNMNINNLYNTSNKMNMSYNQINNNYKPIVNNKNTYPYNNNMTISSPNLNNNNLKNSLNTNNYLNNYNQNIKEKGQDLNTFRKSNRQNANSSNLSNNVENNYFMNKNNNYNLFNNSNNVNKNYNNNVNNNLNKINNNYNNNYYNNSYSYSQKNNYHNRVNYGQPYKLLGSGGGGPFDTYIYGNKSNKSKGPKLTLDQCFESFLKPDYLTGDNQQYCNKCHVLSDAIYTNYLYSSPNILILILNYGKGILFECDVLFDEYINISKYIDSKTGNVPTNYRLLGAIVHIGPSSMGGHFIAYCRSIDKPDKWYKLNDSLVSEATFSEIKNVGIPYVLFYENVNKY